MSDNKPYKGWGQLIETTQKLAEANAAKTIDPVVLLDKTALIATAILEKQITAHDVSMITLAMSVAKVSEDRLKQDNYRDVILNAAYAGQIVGIPTTSMANIRVMAELNNQANAPAS